MKKVTDRQALKARYRAAVFQAEQAEQEAKELVKTLKQARAYLKRMLASEGSGALPEALAYEGLGRERFLAAAEMAGNVSKRAAATAFVIEHNRASAREQTLVLLEQAGES